MQRQQTGRIAGIILALLIPPLAVVYSGRAQSGDTPIVILDGSLTMESAVPWGQFTGAGDLRSHPHTTKSVTKVVVTTGGTDRTVTFQNEQCTVDITYASANIRFTTGPNGRGLRFTPFSAFQDGGAPNRLAHKDQSGKITHVLVTRAGVTALDAATSNGTKIVISYQ